MAVSITQPLLIIDQNERKPQPIDSCNEHFMCDDCSEEDEQRESDSDSEMRIRREYASDEDSYESSFIDDTLELPVVISYGIMQEALADDMSRLHRMRIWQLLQDNPGITAKGLSLGIAAIREQGENEMARVKKTLKKFNFEDEKVQDLFKYINQ